MTKSLPPRFPQGIASISIITAEETLAADTKKESWHAQDVEALCAEIPHSRSE